MGMKMSGFYINMSLNHGKLTHTHIHTYTNNKFENICLNEINSL